MTLKDSPYIKENKLDKSLKELEDFLIDELDVQSFSELVLLFESLKSMWQRDDTYQDIAEGVHLQYQEEK